MNILLVQTGFLGDVILSTPVISNLKQSFPEAKLFMLTTPLAHSLVAHHPDLEEALVYDKRGRQRGVLGLANMAGELKSLEFAKVFSLHKSLRTGVLLWRAGIPERLGFEEAAGKRFYTGLVGRSDLAHEVLRNLAILRHVGLDPRRLDPRMKIVVPEDVATEVSELLAPLSRERFIAISPGSVWATKRWSADRFGELAVEFLRWGYKVVLIGGKGDTKEVARVQEIAGDEVLSLLGKTSPLHAAEVISRASLLITNDSAPLHMASSMGTPVVALFCATVPGFGFGPWQVRHECIEVDRLPCRPCARHGGKRCPERTYACIEGIEVSWVLESANKMLGNF